MVEYTTRGLSYLKNTNDDEGGCCKYGHYNIIPASTAMIQGNKLYCHTCETVFGRRTLIFEVVNAKITTETTEIKEKAMSEDKLGTLIERIAEKGLRIIDKFMDRLDKKCDDGDFMDKLEKFVENHVEVTIEEPDRTVKPPDLQR